MYTHSHTPNPIFLCRVFNLRGILKATPPIRGSILWGSKLIWRTKASVEGSPAPQRQLPRRMCSQAQHTEMDTTVSHISRGQLSFPVPSKRDWFYTHESCKTDGINKAAKAMECVSALKFLQGDVKVNLKLRWRPQPIRDDRLMGQLQRKVAGRSRTEIKATWTSGGRPGKQGMLCLGGQSLHHKLQMLDSELRDLVFHWLDLVLGPKISCCTPILPFWNRRCWFSNYFMLEVYNLIFILQVSTAKIQPCISG